MFRMNAAYLTAAAFAIAAGGALLMLSRGHAGAQVVATTAAPVAAPRPATSKPAKIYNENADPKEQIAAALARAKKDNKRVLIQFGGDWCGWCVRLHQLMKADAEIARVLSYEYEYILIDVPGTDNKNADFPKTLGATVKGYPHLTVLDANGKVLVQQDTEPLEVKNDKGASAGLEAGHDKAKVLEFLKKYVPEPLTSEALLTAALAEAKKTDRKVFLHFGAPWCGWCRKLEAWMDQPKIAALLEKEFVDLKIDEDRQIGGKEMKTKFGADGGIPWIAFMDANGKSLITSTTDGANTGFPASPEEIERFGQMLTKTAKHLTAADILTLVNSLKEENKTPAANAAH